MVVENEPVKNSVQMEKTMGVWHGVSVIVSSMIGSGIFVTANSVLAASNSQGIALITWALAAILIFCGSRMYGELGCMMPKAGGDYEYISCSAGPLFAFLFSFIRLTLIVPAGTAVGGLAFGNYLLKPIFPCGVPHAPQVMLGFIAVAFFGFLNCWSITAVKRTQLIFAIGKTAALVGVIIAGCVFLAKGGYDNLEGAFSDIKSISSIISGFYGCIFTFAGWNYLGFVAEEMKQPEKDIPRAATIAVVIVGILYLLTNVAYFSSMTKDEAMKSTAIAVDMLEKLHPTLGIVVSILVSLSVFGLINSQLFTTSRVVFSAARNRHMPTILSYIHCHYLTPVSSVIVVTAITMVYMMLGTVNELVVAAAFAEAIFFVVTFFGYIYLRFKRPDIERLYRAPLVPVIVFGIAMIFICVFGLIAQTKQALFCLIFIAIGAVLYYFAVSKKRSVQTAQKITTAYTFVQKLVNSVPVNPTQQTEEKQIK